MANVERRVDAWEARVEDLAVDVEQASAVSAAASQDAMAAIEAHRHNTRLLTALRETQAEHTQLLASHSQLLAEHSRAHDQHRMRFDRLDATLARLTVGVHTIEQLLVRALDDDGR